MSSDERRIVILGGGVMGCSVAYRLARRGVACTIVESCAEIASQASGKAGGFLAESWCDGSSSVGPLARLSFRLHREFAADVGAEQIGYRPMAATLSVTADEVRAAESASAALKKQPCQVSGASATLPPWMNGAGVRGKVGILGSSEDTAQVHPRKLTRTLFSEAVRLTSGATKAICDASVEQIVLSADSTRVRGIRLRGGDELPADTVVVTMGPWSGLAASWFPTLRRMQVRGHRAHSITLHCVDGDAETSNRSVSAYAIFLHYREASGVVRDPEIYPRSDEVYLCGMSDDAALPAEPKDVHPDLDKCAVLQRAAASVSQPLARATLTANQACYLPISPDGDPVVGAVPGIAGAYVATGHSCWGILNSHSTGLAMAELILDGRAQCVDISALTPARFVSPK